MILSLRNHTIWSREKARVILHIDSGQTGSHSDLINGSIAAIARLVAFSAVDSSVWATPS